MIPVKNVSSNVTLTTIYDRFTGASRGLVFKCGVCDEVRKEATTMRWHLLKRHNIELSLEELINIR